MKARITTAGRIGRALIGLSTMAGFALLVPGTANADPVGCGWVGENIVCVAGVGVGETLTGTDNGTAAWDRAWWCGWTWWRGWPRQLREHQR